MEKYQEQAWDCLTQDEQNSLFLNTSQGMSTWGVGEVLKLSHYKYLELKARAEKFFKLFSDYFQLYPSLVRPKAPIGPIFRDYLFGTMIKRLPKEDALTYAGDSSFRLKEISNKIIQTDLLRLKESSNQWDRDLYKLIMEFDRWNNYRILPRMLQAPSAYDRRTNKKHKTYLRYLHQIPDFKIKALVDMYWKGPRGKPESRYYISLVSTFFDDGYAVIPILKDEKVIKAITDNKLYIFETQDEADDFGLLTARYYEETVNSKKGLKFWKRYRELIENAINYRQINNMDFTSENLDMAFGLKRIPLHKRRKQKPSEEKFA